MTQPQECRAHRWARSVSASVLAAAPLIWSPSGAPRHLASEKDHLSRYPVLCCLQGRLPWCQTPASPRASGAQLSLTACIPGLQPASHLYWDRFCKCSSSWHAEWQRWWVPYDALLAPCLLMSRDMGCTTNYRSKLTSLLPGSLKRCFSASFRASMYQLKTKLFSLLNSFREQHLKASRVSHAPFLTTAMSSLNAAQGCTPVSENTGTGPQAVSYRVPQLCRLLMAH